MGGGGRGDEKRGQFFSHFSGVTKKGVQLTFYSIFRWGGGGYAGCYGFRKENSQIGESL